MGMIGKKSRATFSTWVTEQTDTPTEIRELALAHISGDKVAAAYQRSVLLEKRRTLMERWGRFCVGGEGEIIELRPATVAGARCTSARFDRRRVAHARISRERTGHRAAL